MLPDIHTAKINTFYHSFRDISASKRVSSILAGYLVNEYTANRQEFLTKEMKRGTVEKYNKQKQRSNKKEQEKTSVVQILHIINITLIKADDI